MKKISRFTVKELELAAETVRVTIMRADGVEYLTENPRINKAMGVLGRYYANLAERLQSAEALNVEIPEEERSEDRPDETTKIEVLERVEQEALALGYTLKRIEKMPAPTDKEMGEALGELLPYIYDHIHSVDGLQFEVAPNEWKGWCGLKPNEQQQVLKRHPWQWVMLIYTVRGHDVADDPK